MNATITADSAPPSRLTRWHRLGPVQHRYYWIGAGLLLQAAAIGLLGAWAYTRYHGHESLELSAKASVLLVWDQTVHSRAGLAVCAAAAMIFAAGSVVAARPFVRRVELLVVVVPLAAVAGVAALGALVVVVFVGYFVLMILDGLNGVGGGSKAKDEDRADPT